MNDDKLRILKLLEDGKINAEEAYRLLKASGENKGNVREIVIKVKSEEENVNIRLPVSVMKASLKLGGGLIRFIPENTLKELEEKNIDIQNILKEFGDSLPEKPTPILEVETDEGEYVYIGFE